MLAAGVCVGTSPLGGGGRQLEELGAVWAREGVCLVSQGVDAGHPCPQTAPARRMTLKSHFPLKTIATNKMAYLQSPQTYRHYLNIATVDVYLQITRK